jgi:NAD(P)-dependent dehydrogenase (short-subunit alcohol dehydrogenase family)
MKRVLITGANKGIGYSMARQLLSDGYAVSVIDIDTDNLEELKKDYKGRLLPLRCDVRNGAAMAKAVALSARTFGGIDIAVHNACRCGFRPADETGFPEYRDIFDVNFYGALRLARLALRHIEPGGRIIFTSSGVGVTGFVNISPYASSKGAIESLAKCLNLEYSGRGISFHIFHPPLTRTDSASCLPMPGEFMADPVKVGAGLAKRINKNRFIICHSFGQKIQAMLCYLFPVKMGKLLGKLFQGSRQGETEEGAASAAQLSPP